MSFSPLFLTLALASLSAMSSFGLGVKKAAAEDPLAEALSRFEGRGTENDPYLIRSTDDLVAVKSIVNDRLSNLPGVHFRQMSDLDLSGLVWDSIGDAYDSSCAFRGTYDGNGFKISHIETPDDGRCHGLFSRFGGVGMNIMIESGTIRGWCSGGIVSHSTGDTYGLSVNCYTAATVVTGNRAGGIADNFLAGRMLNCLSLSELQAPVTGGMTSCEAAYCFNMGYRGEIAAPETFTGAAYECFSVSGMSNPDIVARMNNGIPYASRITGISEEKLRRFVVDGQGNIAFGDPYRTEPDYRFGKPLLYTGLGFFAVAVVSASVVAVIQTRAKKKRKDEPSA